MNDDQFFILERLDRAIADDYRLLKLLNREINSPELAEATHCIDIAYEKISKVLVDHLKELKELPQKENEECTP